MFLRSLSWLIALTLTSSPALAREIRVCADPDNLPSSNRKEEGYENRIVQLLGESLPATISYVWWTDRRRSALKALQKGQCDLVPGMLSGAPGVLTTRPYMRSSYTFVSRAEIGQLSGFDDARLRTLTIGVQSLGEDGAAPPVAALFRRNLTANIRPYTLRGHYSDPNSAAGIVHAVAAGNIDTAVLWGPFAGYFVAREKRQMTVTPASSQPTDPPMRFAIAMATRRDDTELRDAIDRVLSEKQPEIASILEAFHVPLLPLDEKASP